MDDNRCEQCQNDSFTFLGQLGNTTWIRCRNCGWDQQVPESQEIRFGPNAPQDWDCYLESTD